MQMILRLSLNWVESIKKPTVSVPEPRDEGIALALPGGCGVRIGRGFDAVTLDRLLTVIQRRS